MRRAGKKRVPMMGILLAAAFLGSGCGKGRTLEQAYSFPERASAFLESSGGSGTARASGTTEGEDSAYSQTSAAGGDLAPLFAQALCVPMDAGADSDTPMTAQAGALFDVTDAEVLYHKNVYDRLYPASTTKVMTFLLAAEAAERGEVSLEDLVTVTEESVIREAGATLCGIQPGDQISLEQLLYGLLIPSGNDAGNAIAVYLDGSLDAFADRMNKRAASLGATGTHFVNPSGLHDENHYTTAYDLYLIFQEARKHALFREITGASSYTARYADAAGQPIEKTWTVGNWYQKGERPTPEGLTVLGGKTGTTQAAGYCLIMASQDEAEREYVSVVLKSDSRSSLYDNMTWLLENR